MDGVDDHPQGHRSVEVGLRGIPAAHGGFETFADLQAAPEIMAEIIQHPEFAKRLDATGRRPSCSYRSADPVRRDANSPSVGSPRQKSRTVSR